MSLNDYERDLIKSVKTHGWQCISVLGEENSPPFAYTVGFWETLCTPELIVFGLGSELMHEMLWTMYDELRKGRSLSDHARWPLLRGHDCISRRVHPSRVVPDHFNSALWCRRFKTGETAVDAYQLFWPGAQDGLFPWEAGCDSYVRELQPLLYLPAKPANA